MLHQYSVIGNGAWKGGSITYLFMLEMVCKSNSEHNFPIFSCMRNTRCYYSTFYICNLLLVMTGGENVSSLIEFDAVALFTRISAYLQLCIFS